ncbi:hypothetical protein [Parvularcula sp. LCG005]|uniref:hypothetical protein n=1 Tax=Parvularcula sp. LCG005 TaxID=3078805 RepID=UPI002943A6C3|nr:hypothetical protein [Parvularcula sp. LCG005]WOI53285.1 hypothetical protein RUI03_14150 [Parvularcula sp. LCG005]
MGGIAFLGLLMACGIVIYWFGLNSEKGAPGNTGLLGIRGTDAKDAVPVPTDARDIARLSVSARFRARVKGALGRTAVERVRARSKRQDPQD